ncbi:MAG: carboxypeptidase-like regulatory domain-containing protein [Thermoguttaceae bacterium]
MKYGIAGFTVAICFVVLCGCGGEERPKDMPPVFPCTLTITQDGKPLEGALVALYNQDAALQKWTAGGTTDASGSVTPSTQGRYRGVVPGKYKITVTKIISEGGVVISEETATTPEKSTPGKTWSYVEKKYDNIATTPLEIDMPKSKFATILDAGVAVKNEVVSY